MRRSGGYKVDSAAVVSGRIVADGTPGDGQGAYL